MPEFSKFNGYTVKDETARNIAKGRNQAVAFSDYATMIETLNAMDKEQYKTGQNIYIGTVGVPDLWVYAVEDILHTFSYVSDEDVVEKLTENTTIKAGYYALAMLEGQKVDLTTYNEILATQEEKIDELTNSLREQPTFIYDENGQITGYTTKIGGADTVYPFNNHEDILVCARVWPTQLEADAFNVGNFEIPSDGVYKIYFASHCEHWSSTTVTIGNDIALEVPTYNAYTIGKYNTATERVCVAGEKIDITSLVIVGTAVTLVYKIT